MHATRGLSYSVTLITSSVIYQLICSWTENEMLWNCTLILNDGQMNFWNNSYCVPFKLDAIQKSHCKKDIESNSVLCDLLDSNMTDWVTDVVVFQSQTVHPQSTHSTFSDRLMYSAVKNRLKSSVLIWLVVLVIIRVFQKHSNLLLTQNIKIVNYVRKMLHSILLLFEVWLWSCAHKHHIKTKQTVIDSFIFLSSISYIFLSKWVVLSDTNLLSLSGLKLLMKCEYNAYDTDKQHRPNFF